MNKDTETIIVTALLLIAQVSVIICIFQSKIQEWKLQEQEIRRWTTNNFNNEINENPP